MSKAQRRNDISDIEPAAFVKQRMSELDPFWKALSKETDRSVAILSACILDDSLEKLIRASYVRDPKVKELFKNDHILQSFFAKINIAYYSGLIPSIFYHDLKLICEIRNRFAHELTADLAFTHNSITQRVAKFKLGPQNTGDEFHPKTKFIIVVSQIAGILMLLKALFPMFKPPHFVEVLQLEKDNWLLTTEEIIKLQRKIKPD